MAYRLWEMQYAGSPKVLWSEIKPTPAQLTIAAKLGSEGRSRAGTPMRARLRRVASLRRSQGSSNIRQAWYSPVVSRPCGIMLVGL